MPPELITRPQADVIFGALLVLGMLLAPAAGLVAKQRGQRVGEAAAIWGGPLVLIGLLWRVYNAITDRIGLQTVMNLLVNAVVFILIGAIVGIGWVFWTQKSTTPEMREDGKEA